MKAVILNSGIGKRMGDLTKESPKCLVELISGETILSKQIKDLLDSGIDDFLITTGPFNDRVERYIDGKFPDLKVTYVANPLYESTNYIYSMFLAEEQLNDDVILLHGDIVADGIVFKELLTAEEKDAVIIDTSAPLPEKDFKGRLSNGKVVQIGTYVDGDDCSFLLPVYKLSKEFMAVWMDAIKDFMKADNKSVYAEEALNLHLDRLHLSPFDISGKFCMEIDTPEDLLISRKAMRQ